MAFDNDVAVLEIAQPCSSLKNAWKNTIEPASRKSAIGCEGWTTVIRHILTVLLRTRHHGERRHPANCRNELAPPHSGTRSVVVQARRIPVLDRHRTGCCITTGAARGGTLRVPQRSSAFAHAGCNQICLGWRVHHAAGVVAQRGDRGTRHQLRLSSNPESVRSGGSSTFRHLVARGQDTVGLGIGQMARILAKVVRFLPHDPEKPRARN